MKPEDFRRLTWLNTVLDDTNKDDFAHFFNNQQRSVLQAEFDRLTAIAKEIKP